MPAPQSPTPPSLTQPPGFILLQLKGKSGFAYQVFWSQAWSALRTSWAQKMLWRPHRISFEAPLGFKKCFGVRTESRSGHILGSKNALASAQNRFLGTSWAQKMLWRPRRIAFGAPLGFKKCFGVRTESLSGHLLGSKNALASAQDRFRDTSWVQKMLWRPHRIAFGTPRGSKKCFGVRTESLSGHLLG